MTGSTVHLGPHGTATLDRGAAAGRRPTPRAVAPRPRTTRIVATVGPASSDVTVLVDMLAAGMDVARINCSHGSPARRMAACRSLRAAAAGYGADVRVLFDIAGPKLRLRSGPVGGIHLAPGDVTMLVGPRAAGIGADALTLNFDHRAVEAQPGHRVFLDDGRLVGRVITATNEGIKAEIERGGQLLPNKAVCFPDSPLRLPAIGPRDRADLARAGAAGVDAVALSFVETAADVLAARRCLPPTTAIVAKVERAAAVRNLPELLDVADALMVARGDLGVELPLEQLPLVQKDVIEAANERGVPVICATEMLESMRSSHRPTRAEATDVANAVLDGADAVMLSAETATGVDPAAAVAAMSSIVSATEANYRFLRTHPRRSAGRTQRGGSDLLASRPTRPTAASTRPGAQVS